MMLKLMNLLKCSFVAFFLTQTIFLNACTIFMANDGQNVWVGNNEDEIQTNKYRLWFYPAKKNSYGYVIWTDLNVKLLSSINLNMLAYLNPQGGLNEHGLFMDYTAIDEIKVTKDEQKKDRKEQVATDLLKNCKTVDEALAYISKFNLIKLNAAQLFIGDATGNYATVTGGYVVKKTDNSFALTNYCINDGKKQACHRRDVATYYLNNGTTFQLSDIANILEKAAQKFPYQYITHYSMAINLKSATINLYYKHDFTTVATLSLAEELKKGKHHKDIETYFPENITPILEKTYKNSGITTTIAQYKSLRQTSFNKYNFKNDDALNLAISWIDKGETTAALQLLHCLNEYDTTKTAIQTWIGVANKKINNIDESNKIFAKILSQNPNDYLATLWGKQEAGKITFKLTDFEAAERVWLVGEFTNGLKNPIKMRKENGYWTCEVTLPKGEATYRFVVNNSYYVDFKNILHAGKDENTLSKIYVW
jgi:Glycogen recognition site of AMP-activated protein kinase